MEILLAALAFSVLMIVFSTIVTSLTETYLRIFARRPGILADTVLQYLKDDQILRGYLAAVPVEALNRLIDNVERGPAALTEAERTLKSESNDLRRRLLSETRSEIPAKELHKSIRDRIDEDLHDILTINRPRVASKRISWGRWIREYFVRKGELDRVDTLSTYSFLQRLAETEVGKKIAKKGDELALRGLTMGFERYIAASNEVFRKHAQSVTMLLSIALAFGLNIDAVRLFNYLVENPSISEEISGKIDDVKNENTEALQKLEAALATLEPQAEVDPTVQVTLGSNLDPNKNTEVADGGIKTNGDPGSSGGGEANDEEKDKAELIKDVKASVAEIQETLATLQDDYELPFGPAYFPYGDKGRCMIPSDANGSEGAVSEPDSLTTKTASDAVDAVENSNEKPEDAVDGKGRSQNRNANVDNGSLDPSASCEPGQESRFWVWGLQTLLAGFLIGLGGPFWYKFFTTLSHVVQLLRAFRGQSRSEYIRDETNEQQPASASLIEATKPPTRWTEGELMKQFRALAGLSEGGKEPETVQ